MSQNETPNRERARESENLAGCSFSRWPSYAPGIPVALEVTLICVCVCVCVCVRFSFDRIGNVSSSLFFSSTFFCWRLEE